MIHPYLRLPLPVLLLLLLQLFLPIELQGQTRHCLAMQQDSIFLPNAKGGLPAFHRMEAWLQTKIEEQRKLRKGPQGTEEQVYILPVIVHVIHNGEPVGMGSNLSREQVLSQFTVLNEDFGRKNADRVATPPIFRGVAAFPNIQFRPALLDPEGNPLPEPGIHRYNGEQGFWAPNNFDVSIKPATSWDPKRYLNIWAVRLSGGTLGYASWPKNSTLAGVPPETDADNQDGVVVNSLTFGSNNTAFGTFDNLSDPLYNQGRSCSHEVGHYLGLLHPWGIFGGCTEDDFCSDTPTTSRNRDEAWFPCSFPHPENPNTCTDDGGNDLPDMFQNFMDYSADACMNLFTEEQKLRMRTVLAQADNRREVLRSAVILPHFPPQNLSLNRLGNQVTVRWEDAALNEAGFEVARGENPNGPFTNLGTTGADSTSFVDPNAPEGQAFYYRVRAFNQAGSSIWSLPIATEAAPQPAQVQGFTVTALGQDSILLNWQPNGNATTHYRLEWKTGTTPFAPWPVQIAGTLSSFTLFPVAANLSYTFRLIASNGTVDADPSDEATTTTLPWPPAAPSNLSVTFEQDIRRFRLRWQDNANDEDSFLIERANGEFGEYEVVHTAATNDTIFLDADFTPSAAVESYYRVRASNAGGLSGFSNFATFDPVTGGVEDARKPLPKPVVFPNPIGETLSVQFPTSPTTGISYTLYGVSGRVLKSGSLHAPLGTINCSGLAEGLYLLKIQAANTQWQYKVVKR